MSTNVNSDVSDRLALLQSLEEKSCKLAETFQQQLDKTRQQLELISNSTVEASSVYRLSTKNLAYELDESIAKTLELITHCDELDKDLSQLQDLSRQVKAVDKALNKLQKALGPLK
ncbi:hypothetical protein BDF20DRAFT_846231 [Mycotypha africana]|uniref:uncharacterized protein n=1 Tax=Mycotypha africana TaxID=64632 RepID=UPI00230152BF|nr:uncharacterized protein BDF20DRAFT_846231 [Mycotypha africana]KAI8991754.1 hypothetical protein BDF20DRAFT_846231 [Mycotypha africana]